MSEGAAPGVLYFSDNADLWRAPGYNRGWEAQSQTIVGNLFTARGFDQRPVVTTCAQDPLESATRRGAMLLRRWWGEES